MDRGLGEDLIGGGLEDELRQPIFSIGLKGVKPENLGKARAVNFVSRLHSPSRLWLPLPRTIHLQSSLARQRIWRLPYRRISSCPEGMTAAGEKNGGAATSLG